MPYDGYVYAMSVDTNGSTGSNFTVALRYKGSATDLITLDKVVGPEFGYDATYALAFSAGDRFACYIIQGDLGGGAAAKPIVAVYGAFI